MSSVAFIALLSFLLSILSLRDTLPNSIVHLLSGCVVASVWYSNQQEKQDCNCKTLFPICSHSKPVWALNIFSFFGVGGGEVGWCGCERIP